jgi:hypothetical protein
MFNEIHSSSNSEFLEKISEEEEKKKKKRKRKRKKKGTRLTKYIRAKSSRISTWMASSSRIKDGTKTFLKHNFFASFDIGQALKEIVLRLG